MELSYKKLWVELVKRDMNNTDLVHKAGISWASVTQMSKNENVSIEVQKSM